MLRFWCQVSKLVREVKDFDATTESLDHLNVVIICQQFWGKGYDTPINKVAYQRIPTSWKFWGYNKCFNF